MWLREDAEGNVDIRDMEQKLQVSFQIRITKSLTNRIKVCLFVCLFVCSTMEGVVVS